MVIALISLLSMLRKYLKMLKMERTLSQSMKTTMDIGIHPKRKKPRALESVILKEDLIQSVLDDVQDFIES